MLENVILVILRRKIGYAVYPLIFYFCKYSSMKRIVKENMDFQNFFFFFFLRGGGRLTPPSPPPPRYRPEEEPHSLTLYIISIFLV